jgi:signal transduction histidine kinase
VQEEVFRSVSRELHDDFGQILTAVGIMLRRIEKRHVAPDDPLREELGEIRQVVQETLEKTRSFSQALHPTVLDDYGLERAVERYIPLFEKQTGIAVQLEKHGTLPVRDQKAIHIYRVLQEALNNIAKHSGAKQAFVGLELGPERVRLSVRDHGVGMDGDGRSGLGLIAMRERAEILRGALRIESPPDGGTLVILEVPVAD